MEIVIVNNKENLKKFIEFPWQIYKGDNNWVPPLKSDVDYILSEKNPFWEHAEKELFLLMEDSGQIIGRIAAIIDRNYINLHNIKAGFFGFFECVNILDASKELFQAAKKWLETKGMSAMLGPMNPSTNDECGFLSEGFDSPPSIMMPYNPKYYLTLAENSGLFKAKDLFAYDMDVSPQYLQRMGRIADIARKKLKGLSIRSLKLNDFDNEIKRVLEVYNAAWEKNWGFVPWTEKEFFATAIKMKDLFLLETTLIAEVDGIPVGMLISVPDYNFILKKINGSLSPIGMLKFLYYRGKLKKMRLMIMGVKKEFRMKGIEAAMYVEGLKNSLKLGYEKCEFSWVLEDNVPTQNAAAAMGGKLYKKYRIFSLNF